MGIKIEDGTLKVSAGYSLKVGLPNYSSMDAHAGYSLEVDVTGEEAQVLFEGQRLYDQLTNAAKLSCMATLGIDAEPDDDGVLQPVLGAAQPAPVVQQAAVQQAPQAAPYNGGGGTYNGGGGQGGGTFGPPKADLNAEPRFTADLDGRGVTTWIDLRGVKERGLFKAGAADFRDTADSKHQVWLKDKQGNVKASVAEALQTAGVAV